MNHNFVDAKDFFFETSFLVTANLELHIYTDMLIPQLCSLNTIKIVNIDVWCIFRQPIEIILHFFLLFFLSLILIFLQVMVK